MRSPVVVLGTLFAFMMVFVPPRPGRSQEPDLAAAKQHFEAGRSAYLGGDFGRAIGEFQAAQAIRPSPILDYNIGLSFEALGDGENAYAAYSRYLAGKPDAPNRSEVEQRMQAIVQRAQQPPPPQPAPQPGAAQPAPPTPGSEPSGGAAYQPAPVTPPPAAPHKKRYWWIVFPIVGGVVLTSLVIAAVVVANNSCSGYGCPGNGSRSYNLALPPTDPRTSVAPTASFSF